MTCELTGTMTSVTGSNDTMPCMLNTGNAATLSGVDPMYTDHVTEMNIPCHSLQRRRSPKYESISRGLG